MALSAPTFECFKGKNGQDYFRLRARSGETILSGEGYSSLTACRRGIASIQRHAADQTCYRAAQAKNGKAYFLLVARNNRVIGKSQLYKSAAAMRKGIQAVQRAAPKAGIVRKWSSALSSTL